MLYYNVRKFRPGHYAFREPNVGLVFTGFQKKKEKKLSSQPLGGFTTINCLEFYNLIQKTRQSFYSDKFFFKPLFIAAYF